MRPFTCYRAASAIRFRKIQSQPRMSPAARRVQATLISFPITDICTWTVQILSQRTRCWLVRNAVLLETHWRERERLRSEDPRCASFRKKKKGATCQMLKTLLVSPSNAEIVRFFILSRTQMRGTHFSIGMSCQACSSLTALIASQLLCDKMLCHGIS